MIRYILPILSLFYFPLAASAATASSPVLIGSFWGGFKKYWSDLIGSNDGAVLVALLVAAVALFIITRGRWIK